MLAKSSLQRRDVTRADSCGTIVQKLTEELPRNYELIVLCLLKATVCWIWEFLFLESIIQVSAGLF